MEPVESMVHAGFRPGSRSTFVSAKVDKAIDAQFGHVGGDSRAEEDRTNSLHSEKARRYKERPTQKPNSRRQEQGGKEGQQETSF